MKKLKKIIRHLNRFGYKGVIFLFKTYFKRNQNIKFNHPEYKYPVVLRNTTSDLPTFYDVIFNEIYNINYGLQPEIIIDCGANIGLASVFYKNKFPDAKIISIEPDKSNYELLIENTKNYNDIICLQNGVWNKTTNLIIKDIGLGNWGFMVEETAIADAHTIPAITINDIIKKNNLKQIDILKIDIEGSEKELFESNYENWLSITKVVVIELHEHMREGATKSFFKAMSNYNFSVVHSGENLICFLK